MRVSQPKKGDVPGFVCVECLFQGHRAKPLKGPFGVRQKGDLPGPPPTWSPTQNPSPPRRHGLLVTPDRGQAAVSLMHHMAPSPDGHGISPGWGSGEERSCSLREHGTYFLIYKNYMFSYIYIFFSLWFTESYPQHSHLKVRSSAFTPPSLSVSIYTNDMTSCLPH